MRHPRFDVDYWQLRSGVESNRAHPDTFWIPAKEHRTNLKIGDAAKLIIEFEFQEGSGPISIYAERMWVIVSEVLDHEYVGILDNEFATFKEADDVYLRERAEIPFRPEHVIDIDSLPREYVAEILSQGPSIKWRRDGA